MSSDNLPSDNGGLESLFAKVPADVTVTPDAPAKPISVRLTGDTATDARLLADAYTLRDAKELRMGHSVLLMVWDPLSGKPYATPSAAGWAYARFAVGDTTAGRDNATLRRI